MSNIEQSPQQQSLITDDQLNEAERAFMAMFETPDDSSSGVSASAEDEVVQAPPGTPSSSAAPEGTTPVEGQVVPSESDSAPSPAPPTSDGGEPTGDEHVQSDPAFTFAGVDYQPDQLARAVQVHDWYQRLSDQQVAAIDAVLSGQYNLIPAHSAQPVPNQQQQQAPTQPVAPPASAPVFSGPPPEEAGDWLDPRAQAEVNRLNAQIAQLQQTVQSIQPVVTQQLQSSQQQQLNSALTQIDEASRDFATRYSLDQSQLDAVMRAASEAQVLPALHSRHNGDTKAAMNAALEMMFWTTPTLRDPYVQARTTADLASLTEQAQADTLRKQQMTALSASGGSVPRRDPVPSTKEDRYQAMTEEIGAAMNGA